MRKQFAKSVMDIADQDDKFCVLIGDISHFLLQEFESKHPQKFLNAGICEQSLVGIASGMSISGMRPIVHTIAPFCVERAYEQIKIDMCYQNCDVTIISVGSSFDYASLGCTHHCYEDVAILRALPNMQIFVPGSSAEFDNLLKKTWGNGKPKYFKISSNEHNLPVQCDPFEMVIAKMAKDPKLTIVVNGHTLQKVVESIESRNDIDVLYCSTLSEISEKSKDLLLNSVTKTQKILTIEENSIIGGLGDMIRDEVFSADCKVSSFRKMGIPRKFLTNYGSADEHRNALSLNVEGIKESISKLLGE